MVHRTMRSPLSVLCAVVMLTMISTWSATPVIAETDDLNIRFDDLDSWARERSPRVHSLAQELIHKKAERDDALRWSNPSLGYDREDVEADVEWQITLHKGFSAPLSQRRLRSAWNSDLQATALRVEGETLALLAELKSGYVRLRLLDTYLQQLQDLEEIVEDASSVADARYREGKLSGVERQLIQLSALSLDASRRNALQERYELIASWRADMGIPANVEPNLVTSIGYRPVILDTPQAYLALLDSRPQYQSRVARRTALEQHATAAGPSLLHGIDFFAGYKQIGSDLDGVVAGVALRLPLFDRGTATAKKLEAEARIAGHELAMLRTETSGRIAGLVSVIEDLKRGLDTIPIRVEDSADVMAALSQAYRDGSLTLDSFLNAVQINVTGSKDYYDQLSTYYRNIFQLEAVTGATILTMTPQENQR